MTLTTQLKRYWKALTYEDLTTGKLFGPVRAARYVIKKQPDYDATYEEYMRIAKDKREEELLEPWLRNLPSSVEGSEHGNL